MCIIALNELVCMSMLRMMLLMCKICSNSDRRVDDNQHQLKQQYRYSHNLLLEELKQKKNDHDDIIIIIW